MKCSIIACGETAKEWDRQGYSIGVNDCWKYHPTNVLVVINSFSGRADKERLKIIEQSKPTFFLSHTKWKRPDFRFINILTFTGRIEPGQFYHNNGSSPFVATTVAVAMGFKDIILYGVDMVDHPIIKDSYLEREVDSWRRLSAAIVKYDCRLYLGKNYGALSPILPAWNSAQ